MERLGNGNGNNYINVKSRGKNNEEENIGKETYQQELVMRRKYPDVVPIHLECVQQPENIYTIPNFLCICRIGVSPVISYLIVQKRFEMAVWLSVAAAFTDLLDGYIARKFPSQSSIFGSYLDPLADKICIATLFTSLYYSGIIAGSLTTIVLTRDVFLFCAAAYIRFKTLEPPRTFTKYFQPTQTSAQLAPLTISKINTALQFFLVGTALLSTISTGFGDLKLVVFILSWCVACTTFLSALMYVVSYKERFRVQKLVPRRG